MEQETKKMLESCIYTSYSDGELADTEYILDTSGIMFFQL